MAPRDGYFGINFGPAPLRTYGEARGEVPHCAAGCMVFSDGWDHHMDCPYLAWIESQAVAIGERRAQVTGPRGAMFAAKLRMWRRWRDRLARRAHTDTQVSDSVKTGTS